MLKLYRSPKNGTGACNALSIGSTTDDSASESHRNQLSNEAFNAVIVGAGPIGLFLAKELKIRRPHWNIIILERHLEYSRHHFVKIETHYLNTSALGHMFFKAASSVNPLLHTSVISPVKVMSIMDLEVLWKKEAIDAGVVLRHELVADPERLESLFPSAELFFGADGSKSTVRKEIFGDSKSIDRELQYMLEFRYRLRAGQGTPMNANDVYKTRKILNFYFTEFIRNNEDIIIRFLVDKYVYDVLPPCTFRDPLLCETEVAADIPASLQHDMKTVLNVRCQLYGDDYLPGSAKLTKTALGIYKTSRVALRPGPTETGKHLRCHWFLVGDAAMGVPFFRSLNAGLDGATKLIGMLTDASIGLLGLKKGYALATSRYSSYYGLISFREVTEASVKSGSITSLATGLHAAGASPVQLISWSKEEINAFTEREHPALFCGFHPADLPVI